MNKLIYGIASAIALVWCCANRPQRARARPGWYINGVRPDGSYEMLPVLGSPERDLDDARARIQIPDDRSLSARIYCTGGAHPIANNDGVSVGCQR